MSVHVSVCDCELHVEWQQQQAKILTLVINLENDYLFDSTWK